jgi:hypothetical protein
MLIVSLTQRPEPIEDPAEFFRAALAPWGVHFDAGWVEAFGLLGFWRWLSPAQARAEFAGAAWLDVRSGCPFVGSTLGYLQVEPAWGASEDWLDFLVGPLKEGRGIVAAPTTGQVHQAVVLRRCPLSQVVGKYALDDGGELLDRDLDPYRSAVIAEIEQAVAATGWDGWIPVGWVSSHHNTLRWYPDPDIPLQRWREAEMELTHRFGDVEVELWLYDFDAAAVLAFLDDESAHEDAGNPPADVGEP